MSIIGALKKFALLNSFPGDDGPKKFSSSSSLSPDDLSGLCGASAISPPVAAATTGVVVN